MRRVSVNGGGGFELYDDVSIRERGNGYGGIRGMQRLRKRHCQ